MPPTKPYTYDYQEVLNFIIAYKQLHDGNSPTWREIAEACSISSMSVVAYILQTLERQDKIILEHGHVYRNIIVVGGSWEFLPIKA